ncbi:MAG: hypothetical protein PVG24_12345 [Gammaproteobacteria bacterium]
MARMLISQHGGASRDLAEQKTVELDAEGNFGGRAYWQRILSAIDEELTPSLSTARQ